MALFEKYLVVKKSLLAKAGKGLFTKNDIAKGKRIVEYKGRIQKWKDVKHEDGHNGYLMLINRNAVINAMRSKTFGRYANDATGLSKKPGLRNNAEYVSEGRKCFIESTRKIKKGEEILVGYGREYWRLIRKLKAKS